jgi:hypothetical protein
MSRPVKHHYILLRCVEAGGPLNLDQTYYGRVDKRESDFLTEFAVLVDGEIRVLEDRRFVPALYDNWKLFSRMQRHRYKVPPLWARFWSQRHRQQTRVAA